MFGLGLVGEVPLLLPLEMVGDFRELAADCREAFESAIDGFDPFLVVLEKRPILSRL
jgi:hypothetical protein